MSNRDGEILLITQHYQENRYVRGHVDRADAVTIACREFEHTKYDFDPDAEHTWARWVPDRTDTFGMLFVVCDKGRGAFKVTELTITKAREHRERVNKPVLDKIKRQREQALAEQRTT